MNPQLRQQRILCPDDKDTCHQPKTSVVLDLKKVGIVLGLMDTLGPIQLDKRIHILSYGRQRSPVNLIGYCIAFFPSITCPKPGVIHCRQKFFRASVVIKKIFSFGQRC